MKVLVAEDDPDIQVILKMVLTRLGKCEVTITYQGDQRAASAVDRPKDMSFLLDQMTLWNQGADKRFAGKLGLDAPCASGMSFGAMTASPAAPGGCSFRFMPFDPSEAGALAISRTSIDCQNG